MTISKRPRFPSAPRVGALFFATLLAACTEETDSAHRTGGENTGGASGSAAVTSTTSVGTGTTSAGAGGRGGSGAGEDAGSAAGTGNAGRGGSSGTGGSAAAGGATGGAGSRDDGGGGAAAGGSAGRGGTAGGVSMPEGGVDAGPGHPDLTFAVIGDFGADNADEAAVAKLVASWNPDFVITTGDNNYDGAGKNDVDIGKYYAPFIGNYRGAYGAGSPTNRFWPSPGNHDWDANNLRDYTDYFTLPGNERYYEKPVGLVHLFAVDSDDREPDGITPTSTQGQWLKRSLAASTACHKLVYFHHTPYTSGNENGPTAEMRWPFREWGATVVITGHEHIYERLVINGQLYLVNGLGGDSEYSFGTAVAGSQLRYNRTHGAMRVFVTKATMTYEFWGTDGGKVDSATTAGICP